MQQRPQTKSTRWVVLLALLMATVHAAGFGQQQGSVIALVDAFMVDAADLGDDDVAAEANQTTTWHLCKLAEQTAHKPIQGKRACKRACAEKLSCTGYIWHPSSPGLRCCFVTLASGERKHSSEPRAIRSWRKVSRPSDSPFLKNIAKTATA